MTQADPQGDWLKRLARWFVGAPDRQPKPHPPVVTPPSPAPAARSQDGKPEPAVAPPLSAPAVRSEDRASAPPSPPAVAPTPPATASEPEQPKPDPEDTALIILAEPLRCVLWTQPELVSKNATNVLERVEDYEDSSHFSRSLFKCRECGQLYFYEFYEWVDWDNDNDKIYTTYIPVAGENEIEQLKATDMFGLMRYFPRLQCDAGGPIWRTA